MGEVKVLHHDQTAGVCVLQDEDGRAWVSGCEPTGRVREDRKTERRTQMEGSATETLVERAAAIMEETGWSRAATLEHLRKFVPREYQAAMREGEEEPGREFERQPEALVDPGAELDRRAKAYEAEKKVTYAQAWTKVTADDPDLAQQYVRRS